MWYNPARTEAISMTKARLSRWYNTFKRDRYIKRVRAYDRNEAYTEYFNILHEIRRGGVETRLAVDLAEKEYWRRHPVKHRIAQVENFLLGPFWKVKKYVCERLDKAIMKALRPN